MSNRNKDKRKEKDEAPTVPAAAAAPVPNPATEPPPADAAPPAGAPTAGSESEPKELRTDGPTLEEYVAAGYSTDTYPPEGYAAKPSTTDEDACLTLADLRDLQAVRSESADGGFVDVVTKGGVSLRFPGDEKKAAALTDVELFGIDEPPAPAETTQAADEQALIGNLTPTQRAMAHWGLEARHILKSAEYTLEDQSIEVRILTHGGQRLYFPRDSARTLSDMEKGDVVPHAEPGGIFSR